MKSTILLLTASTALFCTNTARAQIQLSSDDIYQPGLYQMAIDDSGGYDLGTPGGNNTWDYSQLKNDIAFKFTLKNFSAAGNSANLIKLDGTDTFDFIEKSSSAVYFVRKLNDFDKVAYKKVSFLKFPLKYTDQSIDSLTMTIRHTGADLGMATYDSVKVIYTEYVTSLVDAWGTLKIPGGNFDALRVKTLNRVVVIVEGKKGSGAYQKIPAYSSDEAFTEYAWYTKNKGYRIAYFDPESNEMEFMTIPTLGTKITHEIPNQIVFSNPLTDEWTLTNQGSTSCTVSLFDAAGKLVISDTMDKNSSLSINTQNLLSGIYFVQMADDQTGAVQRYKVVK